MQHSKLTEHLWRRNAPGPLMLEQPALLAGLQAKTHRGPREVETVVAGRREFWLVPVFLVAATFACGQTAQPAASAGDSPEIRYQKMEQQLQSVLSELSDARQQLQSSQQRIDQLQTHLDAVEKELSRHEAGGEASASEQSAAELRTAVDHLQEQDDILQSQVKVHEQTKIESSSKYPVKLSGLILFNTYVNDGAVDNIDLPILALSRTADIAHGSFAGSMRQTILGLTARGPQAWGARSTADIHFDFFGGIYDGFWNPYAGHVRLRTAHLNLEWPNTTLTAAIDGPVFSPFEPSSYAAVGEPSLAWSGNLWTWAPQIVVSHRFPFVGPGRPNLELGLMDPQAPESDPNGGSHHASPAEASKQPGYQGRLSYSIGEDGHAFTLGLGGYYGRQRYSGSPDVNAWAGTADWMLPVGRSLELSGQFYRGAGLGGQGGGAFKDIFTDNFDVVHGLDDAGGWAQLKAKLSAQLEFNAAMGLDNAFAGELRNASYYPDADIYDYLARNRTFSGNLIFRPRAYLLFSAEYRNLHSWQINHVDNTANSMSLSAGYLF